VSQTRGRPTRPAADPRSPVFHFELRAGIHVAHAFNLGRADLDRAVLDDWRRGELVVFGDRRWQPERAQLKIYEGPILDGPDLSFGRGWTNAVRRGDDVTVRLLAGGVGDAGARPVSPPDDALRREILAQCRGGRIGVHQVLWLTNRWYPERRASERLALAESAVWGLLHEGLIGLRRVGADSDEEPAAGTDHAAEVLAPADWEEILLDWRTWADPARPTVLIEAPPPATAGAAEG